MFFWLIWDVFQLINVGHSEMMKLMETGKGECIFVNKCGS